MHYKEYKTIISPSGNMNLYRGCTHGCIYCNSRSKCYQFEHDFEDIEVKSNALEILESQLCRRRKPCMVGTGAMHDPYLHLESELGLFRECLKIFEKYGYGVALQTKSASVLRDIDLLASINRKTKAVVQITLTTHDEHLCRILEPNVSTTSERFEALCALRDVGIPTVVWICPTLPFINDTPENLLGILDLCARAKVGGIISFGFGMTLREGNREYFYQKLDEHFPELKSRYIRTFGGSYECRSPNSAALQRMFIDFCNANGIKHNHDEIWAEMKNFEQKPQQLSLF